MLKGNINVLSDPSTIMINASLAKTLFGDADPIDKFIRLDNKDNYKVAGVFEDFPHNNDFIRNEIASAVEKIYHNRKMVRTFGNSMEQSLMAGVC